MSTPLTPPDCDLRGMPYMELDVARLIDSDFFAMATGDEFKAGVALWAKSWNQVPAASLPDNDRVLAHLSGAGSRWSKVRTMALHGWARCEDGRLYHPVVAEKALKAWAERQSYREDKSSEAERKARERQDRADMFAALKAAGYPQGWNAKTRDLRGLIAEHGIKVIWTAQAVTPSDGDTAAPPRDLSCDMSQPVMRTVTAKKENGKGNGTKEEESSALPAPAKPEPSAGPSASEIKDAFDQWNALARRAGLPSARDFTEDRRKKIAVRLRAVGADGWTSVLTTIEASDFLRGGGERGWRISLDDVFQTKTWNKIRDGGYGAVVTPGANEIKPEVWARLVTNWRRGEAWPASAGPAPDEPGTRVPRHLLIGPADAANTNDANHRIAR